MFVPMNRINAYTLSGHFCSNMLLYGCEVSAFSVGQLTLPLVRLARANVFGLRAFARVRWKMAMAYNVKRV
jgi:hypothetical protein